MLLCFLRFCPLRVRVQSNQISTFKDLSVVRMVKKAWGAWESRLEEALEHLFFWHLRNLALPHSAGTLALC